MLLWSIKFWAYDIAEMKIRISVRADNMTSAVIKARRLLRKHYEIDYHAIQVDCLGRK